MALLSDEQIDRIVVNRRRYLAGGLLIMLLPFVVPRPWRMGLFSGFMLFSLGIYGAAFRKWRFDRGLWMLAVFLALTLGPCWAYFAFLHYQSLFAGGPKNVQPAIWDEVRFSTDVVVALFLFSKVIKLALSVAVKNWRLARASKRG